MASNTSTVPACSQPNPDSPWQGRPSNREESHVLLISSAATFSITTLSRPLGRHAAHGYLVLSSEHIVHSLCKGSHEFLAPGQIRLVVVSTC
ncbi:hypothetical protein M3J09_012906 [Ascochyta lentis]